MDASTCLADRSCGGVVAAQVDTRQATPESLVDRWLERRRAESRGRSLNAAVKLRRTHIMRAGRQDVWGREVAARVARDGQISK